MKWQHFVTLRPFPTLKFPGALWSTTWYGYCLLTFSSKSEIPYTSNILSWIVESRVWSALRIFFFFFFFTHTFPLIFSLTYAKFSIFHPIFILLGIYFNWLLRVAVCSKSVKSYANIELFSIYWWCDKLKTCFSPPRCMFWYLVPSCLLLHISFFPKNLGAARNRGL